MDVLLLHTLLRALLLSSSINLSFSSTDRSFSYLGNAVQDRLVARLPDQKGKTWDVTNAAVFNPDWLSYTPSHRLGESTKSLVVAKECNHVTDLMCDADFGLFMCNSSSTCDAANAMGVAPTCETILSAKGRKLCVGHSYTFYENIYAAIVKTEKYLDISSLSAPDGRFLAAVRNAFSVLHLKKLPIEVQPCP